MSTTLEPAQDRQSAAPSGRAPRPGLSRDSVERHVFGVLRWVVIAFLLLITIFPFYYTVMLSIRSLDEVLQDPGALWVPPNEWVLDSYRSVVASPESGGQGFLIFMRNSGIIALSTVALTLLVALPGAYAVSRLEFFGRRQISGLFLAVPVPEHPARRTVVRFLHPNRPTRIVGGSDHRVRLSDRRGVDLHAP